jgi:ElaB/YqjD/DUF883 family membrane-anchored ribosome-binding protein
MSRMEDTAGQGQQDQGQQGGGAGMADQVRERAQQVGQHLRDMGTQARDTAQQQYDHLRQQAQEYYETGRARAMEWEQGLEDYVRQQPVKSLLIAAGVGVILGALWKRS